MRVGDLFDAMQESKQRVSCGDDILATLRDLGIWGAEVLEFELQVDENDPEVFWWYCDETDTWARSAVFEVFDGPRGDSVGRRVRIIVLPEWSTAKGEKNG